MPFRNRSLFALLTSVLLCPLNLHAQSPSPRDDAKATQVETIVFLRHGEIPKAQLGQLTPQGLNRALALAKVLPDKFGKPDYLFAPDPAEQMKINGNSYYYVRPLATIEPTAIALSMPVQTPFGYMQIDKLNAELTQPKYASATIFIAWEHAYEAKAAINLLKQFGSTGDNVPEWTGGDFDSLFVVKITRRLGQAPTAAFTLDHENLNNLSKQMPIPAQ